MRARVRVSDYEAAGGMRSRGSRGCGTAGGEDGGEVVKVTGRGGQSCEPGGSEVVIIRKRKLRLTMALVPKKLEPRRLKRHASISQLSVPWVEAPQGSQRLEKYLRIRARTFGTFPKAPPTYEYMYPGTEEGTSVATILHSSHRKLAHSTFVSRARKSPTHY